MIQTTLSIAYLLIAVAAVIMTWREYVSNGSRAPVMAGLGMLSCLVWPLTLIALGASAVRRPVQMDHDKRLVRA